MSNVTEPVAANEPGAGLLAVTALEPLGVHAIDVTLYSPLGVRLPRSTVWPVPAGTAESVRVEGTGSVVGEPFQLRVSVPPGLPVPSFVTMITASPTISMIR
jgi:hypothetical protein